VDDKHTILAGAEVLRTGRRRWVRRKWPK